MVRINTNEWSNPINVNSFWLNNLGGSHSYKTNKVIQIKTVILRYTIEPDNACKIPPPEAG